MTNVTKQKFTVACQQCNRLSSFLSEKRKEFPDYYNLPVPSFGPASAQLLIVGLAPGLHGANRTGRPFTGDYAGVLLYETLFKYGFSSEIKSVSSSDQLKMNNCRISNAVRCVPPQNKPLPEEVAHCRGFLFSEIAQLPEDGIILALGRIAHQSIVKSMNLSSSKYHFSHGIVHSLPESKIKLVDSYHCSRYNTQTRRLTKDMFRQVFETIKMLQTL